MPITPFVNVNTELFKSAQLHNFSRRMLKLSEIQTDTSTQKRS